LVTVDADIVWQDKGMGWVDHGDVFPLPPPQTEARMWDLTALLYPDRDGFWTVLSQSVMSMIPMTRDAELVPKRGTGTKGTIDTEL
jgi:hypothetical protein